LNHTDAKSLNSLDVLAEENGRSFVKHYLLDFGAAFGRTVCLPRIRGSATNISWIGAQGCTSCSLLDSAFLPTRGPNMATIRPWGISAPTLSIPKNRKSNYPNAAFSNRLVGDEFWAAKQVMAFSPQDIQSMVRTGDFSDRATEEAITQILTKRADSIGRTLLPKLLPLDDFRVEGNELRFTDLAIRYDIRKPVDYGIEWARFDDRHDSFGPAVLHSGSRLPAEAIAAVIDSYWVAKIKDESRRQSASVYLRKENAGWAVVGIERDGASLWESR
jgi:hypothetical protein